MNADDENDPLRPATAEEYRAVYEAHRDALTVHGSYTHLGDKRRPGKMPRYHPEDRVLTRWGLRDGPAVCESYRRGDRWTYRVNPAFLPPTSSTT